MNAFDKHVDKQLFILFTGKTGSYQCGGRSNGNMI